MRKTWILALALAGCANGTQLHHDAGTQPADAGVPDAPGVTGHSASGLVTGGVISTSPHYKLVGSTTAHGGLPATSANKKLQTGVVGGSQ